MCVKYKSFKPHYSLNKIETKIGKNIIICFKREKKLSKRLKMTTE